MDEIVRLLEKAKADREQLDEERRQFEQEKAILADQSVRQQRYIELNVGGVRYTTSLTTLTSKPGSMLEAMFSGRHKVHRMPDGSYFIDRDGKPFGVILSYLRTGHFVPPEDEAEFAAVKHEANYFGIDLPDAPPQSYLWVDLSPPQQLSPFAMPTVQSSPYAPHTAYPATHGLELCRHLASQGYEVVLQHASQVLMRSPRVKRN